MNTDFGSIHPASLTADTHPVAGASSSSQAKLNRLSDLPPELIEKIVNLSGRTDRIALVSSSLLGRTTVQNVSRQEQAMVREEIQPFINEIISKLNSRVDMEEIEQLRNIFNQEKTPILDQKTRIATLKNSVINILFSTSFRRMSLSQLVTAFKRFPPSFNGLFEALVAKEEERQKLASQAERPLFASAALLGNREIMLAAGMPGISAHLRHNIEIAGADNTLDRVIDFEIESEDGDAPRRFTDASLTMDDTYYTV